MGARQASRPAPGHPALPGYHIEKRRHYGRLIAGASILGTGYVLTVAATFGLSDPYGDPVARSLPNPAFSLVPIAGPFIECVGAVKSGGPYGVITVFLYAPSPQCNSWG